MCACGCIRPASGPGAPPSSAAITAAKIAAVMAALDGGAPGPLAGRHVLVTAGPTAEPIDPVRVLTNRSSGKQGFAIAGAIAALGARVTLVSGPTVLAT